MLQVGSYTEAMRASASERPQANESIAYRRFTTSDSNGSDAMCARSASVGARTSS